MYICPGRADQIHSVGRWPSLLSHIFPWFSHLFSLAVIEKFPFAVIETYYQEARFCFTAPNFESTYYTQDRMQPS